MIDRVCSLIKMKVPERNRGILWASKSRVPSNVTDADGYQGGCIWINTEGAAGTGVWTNEGSVTVASWVAFDTSAGAGAGTVAFDDATTGPLISIETTDQEGDAYLNPFLITGTYASACKKGIMLSASNPRPVTFLFDNHSVALGAADYRAVLSRVYLCSDQANAITLNAMRAQIKLADGVDISNANSVTAPFTGYFELAGAGARNLDGHVACVRAALETGGSANTVDINLCGFEATLNSTGTFAGSGYVAAFAANIDGGTSKWQYGVYLDAGAVLTTGVYVGAGPALGLDVQAKSRVGTHNWGAASGIAPTAGSSGGTLEVATSIATDIAAGAYASIYANTAITSSIAGDVSAFCAWHELYFNGTDLTLAASNYAATWSMVDVTDAGSDCTFGGLGVGPGAAQLWLAGHTIVFNSDAQLKLSAYRDACGLLVQSGITAGYDQNANANFAAILVTRASSGGAWKEPWPVGLQIVSGSATIGIKLENDITLVLGSTTATAATKITAEFDETTTGIGYLQLGSSAAPMVYNTNPGATPQPAIDVNITHSAGAGDAGWCRAIVAKMILSGVGDTGSHLMPLYIVAEVSAPAGSNYAAEIQLVHKGTDAVTGNFFGLQCHMRTEEDFTINNAGGAALFNLTSDTTRTITCTSNNLNVVLVKNTSGITGISSLLYLASAGAADPTNFITCFGGATHFVRFETASAVCILDTSNIPTAATHKIKCMDSAGTVFYLIGVVDF